MRRRNVVIGAVVVVIGLAAVGSALAPKEDGAAEARAAATLAGNVRDTYGTDDWYVTLAQKDGAPDVQVVASTAFVFTNIADTDLGKSNAATICHDVAAVTNDPNTAASLGLRHVEVHAGTTTLATCEVP